MNDKDVVYEGILHYARRKTGRSRHMSKHLTIRMAWHDNNWDGKVCRNPEGNTYCTGAHSLLSGRIGKKKKTEIEQVLKGKYINGNFDPKNVPPCYWSINAFGDRPFDVKHTHAFSWVKNEYSDAVSKSKIHVDYKGINGGEYSQDIPLNNIERSLYEYWQNL